MSPASTQMLKCFQGEIAKRILQLPKWYSRVDSLRSIVRWGIPCGVRPSVRDHILKRVTTSELWDKTRYMYIVTFSTCFYYPIVLLNH